MVSQISLAVVGYGIVTRHDGICGKEQPREAPSRRMFLCGIDLAGRFGFSARAKIRSPKKLASFREMTLLVTSFSATTTLPQFDFKI